MNPMRFLRPGFAPSGVCYEPATIATIIGVAISAYAGYSSYQQGQEQKKQYEEQAQLQRDENNRAAEQEVEARKRLMARQRMAYLANGVTISGTPIVVGEDTFGEYQKEIDALRSSGAAKATLLQNQGQLAFNSGRAQLISSIGGSTSTMLKSDVFKSGA